MVGGIRGLGRRRLLGGKMDCFKYPRMSHVKAVSTSQHFIADIHGWLVDEAVPTSDEVRDQVHMEVD